MTTYVNRLKGEAVEQQIANDIARRGLMLAPAFLLFGFIGWGGNGVAGGSTKTFTIKQLKKS